ncbi:MAG: nucleoside-diphosphate sugar epimerase/dehydratase [Pseudomonadota bacterium]
MKLRPSRAHLAFLHDILMAGTSFVAAMIMRLGEEAFADGGKLALGALLFTAVAAVVFLGLRLYRGVWHYASINDILAITKATTLSLLVFLPVMFLVTRLDAMPRSVLVINWFVLLILLGGPRLLYRRLKDRRVGAKLARAGHRRIPVLLIGAGDDADLFIRAMARAADAPYEVVGIVGEHETRVGRNIHGIDVMGTVDDIAEVVGRLEQRGRKPQRIVLTKTIDNGAMVRKLMEAADALGIALARMPRLTDFKDGAVDRLEVRPIAVEDLLGRPQAVLDREGMSRLIAGKPVLVTGAGGSIGSELVRQIANLGPSRLAILDASEFALYTIDMELSERWGKLPRAAYIGDVRDRRRLDEVMEIERPALVFHAAALKHVPLVEANPVEGVMTNVIGSRNVADACIAHGVEAMVMISTDKAVNPTNVMGTTKRIAECYCQAMDVSRRGTRFITVRFGNVLGSTGSVVPLFQRQLAAGGPLTVTHPDVVRYFMTIREAVELVLQASVLGTTRHDEGKIYVLDMGEPVRILDLARQMIRLAGLRPDVDVPIRITGLRPGEKLFEEIFHGSEPLVVTDRDGVLLASPRLIDSEEIAGDIALLERLCSDRADDSVRSAIARIVPEYSPAPAPAPAAACK